MLFILKTENKDVVEWGLKLFLSAIFFILVWTIIDVLVDIYPFIILVDISLFSKTFTAVVTIEVTTAQDSCC